MEDFVSTFFEKGYFIIKNLFHKDEVNDMNLSFNNLEDQAKNFQETTDFNNSRYVYKDQILQRIVWCCGSDETLNHFAQDQRLLKYASKILKSEHLQQIISQAHYKNPHDGVTYPMHQDSQNRGYGTKNWNDIDQKGSYVQSVIAIDQMSTDNGPLRIAEGTHTQGHLSIDATNADTILKNKIITTVQMEPGDTLFFGPYLIHGSLENCSNRSRRIFINGFAYPGSNRRNYPGCNYGRKVLRKQE